MPQMTYPGATVAAPSASGPNDDAYFLALFNHVFAQHNTDDLLITAATRLWVPGTDSTLGNFIRRSTAAQDGVGGGGFGAGWIALVPNSATVAGYTHRRFSSGTLSSPIVLYAEDGSTILGQWLYEGTIVAGGGQFSKAMTQTFGAPLAGTIGFSQTFNAGQTANLLQGVVGSNGVYAISPQGDATFARFLFVGGKTIVGSGGNIQLLAIGGLEASATGTDMVLHVAGGWYINSSNITVPFSASTITLTSTGTNRYVGVYGDDGGALALTAYSATAAVTFPTTGAKPLYVCYVPASATQFVASLSGSAGQAVIAADLRFLGGGGSAGGNSGVDWTAAQSTVWVPPGNVRTGHYDGAVNDTIRNTLPPDTLTRISTTGAVATLAYSSNSQWGPTVNGRTRTANDNTTQPALTATASGTVGQIRTLIVDLNAVSSGASDHGIRLSFVSPGATLTSYQMVIQNYYFNTSSSITPVANINFTPFPDNTPLASIGSGQVTRNRVTMADSGAATGAVAITNVGYVAIGNITVISVNGLASYYDGSYDIEVGGNGVIAAGTYFQFAIMVDNVAYGPPYILNQSQTGLNVTVRIAGDLPKNVLGPGDHTITVAVLSVGNNTNTWTSYTGFTGGSVTLWKQ